MSLRVRNWKVYHMGNIVCNEVSIYDEVKPYADLAGKKKFIMAGQHT